MTGPPNAKKIINERQRDKAYDVIAALHKLCNASFSLDLDLVEAIALQSPKADAVAEDAMKADNRLAQKLDHFADVIAAATAESRDLKAALDLG